MKNLKKLATPMVAMLVVSSMLAGCATQGTPGATGTNGNTTAGADAASGECNTAMLAGIGAVVGGLLGGGNNTVRGAALGASLGALACVALNYQSQQVKTAQQVQTDYKVANKGKLPEQSTLVKYETGFTPASVRPGQKAQTNSYIEVAAGTRDPNPLVEEELSLFKPNGDLIKTVRKVVSSNNGSGAYKGGFSIPMPEGVPQGIYPVRTALYLNNKRVGGQDVKLQIVQRAAPAAELQLARAY
ncbi:hypothetical protein D3C81_928620 [compost metagenome]|uniref:hypothetical protein n=1 Tax=Janthinobacterium sp. RT4P48 TaxID=3424188 RepID=UPI000F9F4E82